MREWAANLLGNIDRPEAQDRALEQPADRARAAPVGDRRGPGAAARGGRCAPPGDRRRQGVGAAAPGPQRHDQPGELGPARRRRPHRLLLKGLPPADQKLNALFNRRRDGFPAAKADPGLGAKVFEKHCAICHQLGGKGAKVGPQLDGIGSRGLDRLMEDILDPNRNVDQTFRVTNLALKNGQIVSGLLCARRARC